MDLITFGQKDWTATLDAAAGKITFRRSGQPLPWAIDLAESAHVVTRNPTGEQEQAHVIRLPELTHHALGPNRHQWIGIIGGAGVALEMHVTSEGLRFIISPTGEGAAELLSAVWPGRISFSSGNREICWGNSHQGAMFRRDGRPWSGNCSWEAGALRLVGLTSLPESLAIIVESSHDAQATFADDGKSKMSATVEFRPSLGALTYPRHLLLSPLHPGGHVAIANAFRLWLQSRGLFKSWEQRVSENPNVEKLKGAFIAGAGYYHDDGADQLAAMKSLQQFGFDRGYLFAPITLMFDPGCWVRGVVMNDVPDDQLQQIQQLGYLCSPFLQVEEASPAVGEDKFATDGSGNFIKRWQIDQDKFYEIAKWRLPGMVARLEARLHVCDAVHFDTLTAMPLSENYGRRPYDRRGEVELRLEVARHYRRQGKVVAAESLRDWATLDVDLGTAKIFSPVYASDIRVWAVPLVDLVYHDSMICSNWEHHAWDDVNCIRTRTEMSYHPFGHELNDAMTASPPVLFPEGTLYSYQLKEIDLPDGRKELTVIWDQPPRLYHKRLSDSATQEALPKALAICKRNQRHGTARMISHRFVESSQFQVQETEFSTGLRVVANFGDQDYTLPGGKTLRARSYLAEE